MEIVLVLTTLFMFDNQEFLETSAEQIDQGYKWTYVGKSTPTLFMLTLPSKRGEEPSINQIRGIPASLSVGQPTFTPDDQSYPLVFNPFFLFFMFYPTPFFFGCIFMDSVSS